MGARGPKSCRRLAEAGCTSQQIMAITGHKNLAEVELYTGDVRRDLLAQEAIDHVVVAFPERGDQAESS